MVPTPHLGNALVPRRPRFLVNDLHRLFIEKPSLLVIVANGHNPHLAELRQRAHQVKDYPTLSGSMKVETVVDGDVNEVFGS
jgi:hypothetical protein